MVGGQRPLLQGIIESRKATNDRHNEIILYEE